MAGILYLVHRLPYPPNKGDKIRSYHLLKHLASKGPVYLGAFIDDPGDREYLPLVKRWCQEMFIAEIRPTRAKLHSLKGLVTGEALTLPYYRHRGLSHWTEPI